MVYFQNHNRTIYQQEQSTLYDSKLCNNDYRIIQHIVVDSSTTLQFQCISLKFKMLVKCYATFPVLKIATNKLSVGSTR